MARTTDSGSPAGFGPSDLKLAEDLSSATSEEAADKIAQERGYRDAQDARDWLRSRS